MQDLERYINHTLRHKAEIIRVHIGETHIPSHGKDNVEQLFRLLAQKRSYGEITSQIIRLGHGTHMGFQSMTEAAQHGYYVEACLSSNKETGIIGKRKEYPLGPMLLLGIKVMIGTDGGDLYYTDLKTEYAHAKKNIVHFLDKIAKGNHEVVKLPSGDELQYKHVENLFKDIPQAKNWVDNKAIEFADLKLIENVCKQKINMHQLVDNINEFKKKMFPRHPKKAVLVDESGVVYPPTVKQDDAMESAVTRDIKNQLVKPREKQDPNLKILLGLLESYKEKREKFDGSHPEYKRTFFCIGFGFSKTQKLEAVAALKNALNGEAGDLAGYLATLRNGELGKTIRAFLKRTDTTSFLGKNINTISQLVEHLNKQTQLNFKSM